MADSEDPTSSEGASISDEGSEEKPLVSKEIKPVHTNASTKESTDKKRRIVREIDNDSSKLALKVQNQKETIGTLEAQLILKQDAIDSQIQEFSAQISELKAHLIATKNLLAEREQELQLLQKEYKTAQTIINDKNQIIENQLVQLNEYIKAIHGAKEEQQTYLMQISKLQDLLQQTEGEIREIESGHREIISQMQAEVRRAEIRAGQLEQADPGKGDLARNRHLRTILQESEVGKIVLYIIDYFERKKVRTLALDTLATELGISPIIARKHLRYLHELRICDLNEVTREIKLVT
ncbi:MAG: hypothetical protein ACFFE8_09520 [Candidatus Heimdallarchaeota archaeon]